MLFEGTQKKGQSETQKNNVCVSAQCVIFNLIAGIAASTLADPDDLIKDQLVNIT